MLYTDRKDHIMQRQFISLHGSVTSLYKRKLLVEAFVHGKESEGGKNAGEGFAKNGRQ